MGLITLMGLGATALLFVAHLVFTWLRGRTLSMNYSSDFTPAVDWTLGTAFMVSLFAAHSLGMWLFRSVGISDDVAVVAGMLVVAAWGWCVAKNMNRAMEWLHARLDKRKFK